MTSAQPGFCPELAKKQNNIITVDNVASLVPDTYDRKNGTVTNIACYTQNYTLSGSRTVTCINGSWRPAPPVCVPKSRSTPSETITLDRTTSPDTTNNTKSGTDTSRVVLIVTSCILTVVLIFLLSLILHRCYLWKCKRKNSVKNTSSSLSSIPLYTRPSGSTGWQHTSSTLPLYARSGVSTVCQSQWIANNRAWTYLSVDLLIRDMERSRRDNPDHSWRDFASISAYSTKTL